MSSLLDQAVAEVRKLPDSEQEAIAAWLLDELKDEQRWEAAFARSGDKLKALAERADQQVRDGQFRTAGFDDL